MDPALSAEHWHPDSISCGSILDQEDVDIVTGPLVSVGDDHEYYAFAPKDTDIKIHQLWDYIMERKKQENDSFQQEFSVSRYDLINCFPNKLWFLRVCSTSFLKVYSTHLDNFQPFSYNSKLSSANYFQFGKVLNLSFGKGLTPPFPPQHTHRKKKCCQYVLQIDIKCKA